MYLLELYHITLLSSSLSILISSHEKGLQCQPFLLGEVFGADQHLGFLPYVFRHLQPLLSRWR